MIYSSNSQYGGVKLEMNTNEDKSISGNSAVSVDAIKAENLSRYNEINKIKLQNKPYKLFIGRDTINENELKARDYLYTYFVNLFLKDYGKKRTLLVIPNLINNESNDSVSSLSESIKSMVKMFRESAQGMENIEIFSLNVIADTRSESYERKIKDEFARLNDHIIKDYTKYKLKIEIAAKNNKQDLNVLDEYIHNVIFFTTDDFSTIDLDSTTTRSSPHKYYVEELIPLEFKKFTEQSRIGYQNVSKASNPGFQSQNINSFKRAVSYFKSGIGDNKILSSSSDYSKDITTYHIEAFYELLLHIYRSYTDPKYAKINNNDDAIQIIYRYEIDKDDDLDDIQSTKKIDILFNQSKSYLLIPETNNLKFNFRGYFVSKDKDRYKFKVSKRIFKNSGKVDENADTRDDFLNIRVKKEDGVMSYENVYIDKKTKVQTVTHKGELKRIDERRYYEFFAPNHINTKLSSNNIIHYDYEILIDNDLLNSFKKDVLKGSENISNPTLLLQILSDTNIDELDKLRSYVISIPSLYKKYMLSSLLENVQEDKKEKFIIDFSKKVRQSILDVILQVERLFTLLQGMKNHQAHIKN